MLKLVSVLNLIAALASCAFAGAGVSNDQTRYLFLGTVALTAVLIFAGQEVLRRAGQLKNVALLKIMCGSFLIVALLHAILRRPWSQPFDFNEAVCGVLLYGSAALVGTIWSEPRSQPAESRERIG
jgi:hypothetical protein